MSAEGRQQTDEMRKIGTQLGAQLACLVEANVVLSIPGGQIPDQRCASCAFRPQTIPNGYAPTTVIALKCLFTGEPFYCHQVPKMNGTPIKLCHGWLAGRDAMRAMDAAAWKCMVADLSELVSEP